MAARRDRRSRNWTRQGMALVTALLVSVVVLVLGIGFLTFSSNDYRFAGHEHADSMAFYAARGGMVYYDALGVPAAGCVDIDPPSSRCLVERVGAGGDVKFTGQVLDAMGHVTASRVLVARGGATVNWYEEVR